MIYQLLIAEPPFQVLPTLAGVVGFNEAAVLQVIHYWLDPQGNTYFREGRHWVPNVFEQLYQKFFFWDEETIEYMIAQLEQSGILMVLEDFPPDSSTIKYHAINYELLKERSGDPPVKLVPVTPFINDILPAANKNTNTKNPFTAEVHERGLNIYAMEVQDPAHFLACELHLEIQEEGLEKKRPGEELSQEALHLRDIICHFPKIADAQLKELVWEDVTLYGIIMVIFQMNILKQLLLFCAAHNASNLVIFADDAEAGELGIYRDFLYHKVQTSKPNGDNTEMIIPADRETFDAWMDFMEDVTIRFRQILWTGQKTNPAIHHYLKSRPLSEF